MTKTPLMHYDNKFIIICIVYGLFCNVPEPTEKNKTVKLRGAKFYVDKNNLQSVHH